MTTIGQVTTGGRYHLNLHGLAACGSGTGRIIASTVVPATTAAAHKHTCKRCMRGLARDLALEEATAGLPRGYRISSTSVGLLVLAPFGTGWNTAAASPYEAMRAARVHRGQVVRSAQAAKAEAEAERKAAKGAAAAHFYCRECGGRLSDFDLNASPVVGMHFDCC
jgi:hypothetical protein